MKLKLKEFVKIYGDYDVEFTVVGSETGAVEFIKLSKPKPKPKLTEDEKVILRNLSDEYKYIMRDEKLWVSKSKPDKGSSSWASVCKSIYLDAFPSLFKFITWEDEEPYNIEELLKGDK